jgi:RNA 3'-terminal phosphate cyclase (ATP)
LEFSPGSLKPGSYRFAVGTAGSATLVLQTILPPLLIASEPSSITLEGGTHNPAAPPFDFLQRCFAPEIKKMGAGMELTLRRPGFFPAGGGNFVAEIQPTKQLRRIELLERGEIHCRRARALVSKLAPGIGERELAMVRHELGWSPEECVVEKAESPGPGNALLLEIETENGTAVFTGFGERGRKAEDVARAAITAAKHWMDAFVPVDEHLADQLLLPMALAGGGSFRTTAPSSHTITNASVIQKFLAVPIAFEQENSTVCHVKIG